MLAILFCMLPQASSHDIKADRVDMRQPKKDETHYIDVDIVRRPPLTDSFLSRNFRAGWQKSYRSPIVVSFIMLQAGNTLGSRHLTGTGASRRFQQWSWFRWSS